jgi:hypothetical protein
VAKWLNAKVSHLWLSTIKPAADLISWNQLHMTDKGIKAVLIRRLTNYMFFVKRVSSLSSSSMGINFQSWRKVNSLYIEHHFIFHPLMVSPLRQLARAKIYFSRAFYVFRLVTFSGIESNNSSFVKT